MSPVPESVEVAFIAPRHLAGGGDPAWVTVPLHRACGWSYGQDPLMPRVILTSPDRKALLRLEPDPDGQWWTLHHAPEPDRPAWYASFGARTPVEIIAAFTDALTDPQAGTPTEADPHRPLTAADWRHAGGDKAMTSPDGLARAEHFVNSTTDCWFVTTVLPQGPLWEARFGTHTPPHLIAAFTAALADPTPVPRPTPAHGGSGRGTPLVIGTTQEMPVERVAFALEERVRALVSRRAIPANPCAPQQPPAASNGRSR
ncbi:DUF317 domain-containing protein [Streptomyces sp. SID13666]|uniref:DUF317 domain-containing protein n=1 Tax=Streptomyces sp. SID13666 TaxID=2706054 RepID=UPI0013BEEB48|nr:DUF317 domain-containing protein [Streptomyces sp. SID13666]